MKNLRVILVIVIVAVIAIGIVNSCKKISQKNVTEHSFQGLISLKSTTYQIGELDNNNESSPLMSHDSLVDNVLDADSIIDIVADALGKSIDSVTLRYTWIEDPLEYEEGKSEYYLAVDGLAYFVENSQTQSTYYCYGILLTISGSYLELLVPTINKKEHSCTGNPCSSCKFTKDDQGIITGCECNNPDPGNQCNHSVKTIED